jgi:tetratricopeptide (TPR) repeat protein
MKDEDCSAILMLIFSHLDPSIHAIDFITIMTSIPTEAALVQRETSASSRAEGDRWIGTVMEGLLLALVVLSPWAYGCVHPGFEFLLDVGVAILLLLWGVHGLLQGQFSWKKCPVALCLAALFVTAVWQIVPWPQDWLARLSPHTVEWRHRLLPSQPEILPSSQGATVAPPTSSTISVSPGSTQREALRFLALFLLFVVVRNNLTSTSQFRRLSLVAFANGVLLSLFALVQFFMYGQHLLYGVYRTDGAAFGPFICRNHFPYYINLCLGLGLGLLFTALAARRGSKHRTRRHVSTSNEEGRRRPTASAWETDGIRYSTSSTEAEQSGVWSPLLKLWHRPRLLGLIFLLAILASSIVFSLSRGGTLALVGAGSVCMLVHLRRAASFLKFGAAALVVGLAAMIFLSWFGMERLEERWEKLFNAEPDSVNRLALWSPNVPAVRDFPLWGTGYGSFQYTELLRRDSPEEEGIYAEHAHNDYLEILLEGGIVGLIPVLLMIYLLFRFAYRAIYRSKSSTTEWLATGALFGLTAVVIHSFVDFGLHLPAVALLATVVGAHLCALGSEEPTRGREARGEAATGEKSTMTALRWGGLVPGLAAAGLAVFAVVLVREGWQGHKAERLRKAALELSEGIENPNRQLQSAYLQAAVAASPRDPNLRLELARAQLGVYTEEARQAKAKATTLAGLQSMVSLAGNMSSLLGLAAADACVSAGAIQENAAERADNERLNPLLMPALASYVQVRALCPIIAEPHVRLAASADKLVRADSAYQYLQRAKYLSPTNATIWYLCGKQEFQSGLDAEAWKSWRCALDLSEQHVIPILDQVRPKLTPAEILQHILPDRPKALHLAALYLFPGKEDLEERRPFLEKALQAIAEQPDTTEGRWSRADEKGRRHRPRIVGQPDPLEGEDLYLKAIIHETLDQRKECLAAFQAALARSPNESDWRMNYALILYDEGQLRESARELQTILSHNPHRGDAKEMLDKVRKQIAKKL